MFHIQMNKIKGLKELKPHVQYFDVFHYLHKKKAYLVPKVTKILKEMKASGEIDRISKQSLIDLLK